jgi:C-terminal processing protease CtpA/Prc
MTVTALMVQSMSGAELPSEQDRLIAVGKLWVTVKLFHPSLVSGSIDWDGAVVRSLPSIRQAHNTAEYAEAVRTMLASLHDPATRVLQANEAAAETRGMAVPRWTRAYYGTQPEFRIRSTTAPESVVLPLGGDVQAQVRLSEDGKEVPQATEKADADQADGYPAPEYRILAAYKIWGTIRYFFAYRDLMDEDWDDVFNEFLPKFIAAKDAKEYNLAIAEAITHIDDSSAAVHSRTLDVYFGVAPPGLRTRLVEKKPLITQVLDEKATAGEIHVGDIVTKVDGEDMVERIKREAGYISFSTQQALSVGVMERILNGPEGSRVALTIRTGSGESKEISLERHAAFESALNLQRTGEVTKLLAGNIGYIDLERLAADQVDAALGRLKDTKAIILDGRGGLQVDPAAFAARFAQKKDIAGAIVTGPIILKPDVSRTHTLTETASYFTVETLPPSPATVYNGKTGMLVDERTRGAAEHLGILLEAANTTAFIGSASAGADGATASFTVPGGITITFSASDVRHGNSGKLQRVGLQPTVTVPTTLAGVRSGRDEQLEKALEYLSASTSNN